MPKGQARAALELRKNRLHSISIQEKTYWYARGEISHEARQPMVHLLPAFDEYYLGYKMRDAVLDASYDEKAISSGGVFRPFLLSSGQIIGTWKRKINKKSTLIDVNLFKPLNNDEKQDLLGAAERYGSFLGVPVIISSTAAIPQSRRGHS